MKALEDPKIFPRVHDPLRYLLVDEYQDINPAQERLIELLAQDPVELCVVGDDDQSIYAWRGARPDNLQALARDYPGLRVVKLERNYRNSRTILAASEALIDHNDMRLPKTLWTDGPDGDPIRVLSVADEVDEARVALGEVVREVAREAVRKSLVLLKNENELLPLSKDLTKIAVVGATGNVGREMLNILHERHFPVDEIVALGYDRATAIDLAGRDVLLAVQTSISPRVISCPRKARTNQLTALGEIASMAGAPTRRASRSPPVSGGPVGADGAGSFASATAAATASATGSRGWAGSSRGVSARRTGWAGRERGRIELAGA